MLLRVTCCVLDSANVSLNTMEIWIAVLSSAVVSALVSSLIGGWFALRSKQNEYAHAYYKIVLERRVAAYEDIEHLISAVKVAVVDADRRPYHMLFSNDSAHEQVWATIHKAMSNALWLSDDLFQATREFNQLVFTGTTDGSSLIEFGKTQYTAVADLRTCLEKLHKRDLLTLHDVPGFLKAKKVADGYSVLPPRG